MHHQLRAALTPVLRDLEASCAVFPDIREAPADSAMVWFYAADGSGRGISVTLGRPHAEQVAQAADEAQEWAVEALWQAALPAVWPHCPSHPDSHPLSPRAVNGEAAWFCPRGDALVAPVGRLTRP